VLTPKHGELRGSERWDKCSSAWVRADEWQERQWAREDAAFARKANQGELACPSVIFDSHKPVQSAVTGRWHDSKSTLRREYRQHEVVEVGNDVPKKADLVRKKDPREFQKVREAVGRARAALEIPDRITKIVPDEAGMRRLHAEGKIQGV
jgi:hypothetical protein